jgi:hypothetical protein
MAIPGPGAPPPPEPGILKRLLSPPDPLQVDAGAQGELLVARVRLLLILMLLPIPLTSILFGNDVAESAVGISTNLSALAFAAILYYVLGRGFYRPWRGFASGLMDVTFVSTVWESSSCWASRIPRRSTAGLPSRCISSPSEPRVSATIREFRSRLVSWLSSNTPRWS